MLANFLNKQSLYIRHRQQQKTLMLFVFASVSNELLLLLKK